MKWLAIPFLLVLAWLAWFLTDRLSSDAISMAVGLTFGVLAGIPTALLMAASGRRNNREYEEEKPGQYDFQPPVVILQSPPVTHHHYYDNRSVYLTDGEFEEVVDTRIVRR